MNTKLVLAIVGIVIVAGGAYFLFVQQAQAPQMVQTYDWEFKDLGEDSTGMPTTEVTLTSNGTIYRLGTYSGSCSVIEGSSWSLQEGEKSGVICWWAGGGYELGVFEENGTLVVKKGQLDEGNAETPGFRGNFQTLVEL